MAASTVLHRHRPGWGARAIGGKSARGCLPRNDYDGVAAGLATVTRGPGTAGSAGVTCGARRSGRSR
jgi:hypothetical protein